MLAILCQLSQEFSDMLWGPWTKTPRGFFKMTMNVHAVEGW